MKNGVSVVVCCYNSSQRILETLKYLVDQKVSDNLHWEILIINNASTDDTKLLVSRFIEESPMKSQLYLIDEHEPGLSNARKCGLENARFDILVFCDDDNHLDRHYIQKAFHLMSTNPQVGIVGGWCKPKFIHVPDKWVEDFYGALAIHGSKFTDGYVDWVFGAGMIIRRKIFEELKHKSIKVLLDGRLKEKQSSGEDAELCCLTRFLGYKVYRSADLVLEHQISPHRLKRLRFLKTDHHNFLPTIHLFFLSKLVSGQQDNYDSLVKSFVFERIKRLVGSAPRIIIGNHRFYSFVNFYSSVILLCWLPFNLTEISLRYSLIKKSLNLN